MGSSKIAYAVLPALLAGASLGGCGKSVDNGSTGNNAAQSSAVEAIEEPDAVNAPTHEAARLPTDDWAGRWTGPEGLFLDIQPSPDGQPGHYAITNKDNLDRQGDYDGVADGSTIRFVRDGKDLAIRPGKGVETGFKYLAGKSDCLILVPGKEGYCR
ncbi:hypothetical protein [Sphingobium sp. Sx8-8]|uniref:hypothetical protein n=1 Tax=Sphingobium sp. Sx8-8 TaxID=2933617 RepID=UPI001F55E9BB|nr:hypothetical protein [Sphingobium sp. Sx8-8]